jgi:hypothetical protein
VATTTTALLSSLFRLNADLVSADFAESAAGMPGMPKGAVFGGGVSLATNDWLMGCGCVRLDCTDLFFSADQTVCVDFAINSGCPAGRFF